MAVQASGSRHSAAYILEGTNGASYGVTPATPAFKALRHNSFTVSLQKKTFSSNEIRSDRMLADFRSGSRSVGGNIVGELSKGTFDDLLEAVLCGTWTVRATETASTISAAASDNSYNDSANGFVTAGFIVGDVITASGFGTGANNTIVGVVTSVAAGKIIVTGPTLVNEAAGAPRTLASNYKVLKAGTTRRSFTIERLFGDITQYLRYTGCEFNTLALTANAGAIVGATFGVLGQSASSGAVIIAGATYSTPLTTTPMDALTGTVSEGGVQSGIVTAVTFNLANGMVERQVIGGGGLTLEPSIGRSMLTGDVELYFQDLVAYNKFLNDTGSSIEFGASDGTNTFDFLLPHIKYTAAPPDVTGEGPVMLKMPFQALYDAATGTNIVVTRSA